MLANAMAIGSANNIYVIPAPQIITFGTATLLAAACCIPAILNLISTWDKILQVSHWPSFCKRCNRTVGGDFLAF
jgi:hypothetical protein